MQHLKLYTVSITVANLIWASSGQANSAQKYEGTSEICTSAVHMHERLNGIPKHLLNAISQAESGRWHKKKQANIAWPWTITTGGTGKYYETKIEAVAAVEILRTNGVSNIDVGCMQINLAAHANAFETVEHAFDPITNVAYGAKYLKIMYQRAGNWLKAAGNYHSMTPHLSAKYRIKISRIWNKLRGTQQPNKDFVEAKPISNVARQYSKKTIDYARSKHLNRNFEGRLSHSTEAGINDPVSRKAKKRLEQITAWRKSRSRGGDLSVLASKRRAEHAKRQKRKLAAYGKGDRRAIFAERRRQQLNLWRNRKITVAGQN